MNQSGTSVLIWRLQWYVILVAARRSCNVTAKSLKIQNGQKLLKLMIPEIPYGNLLKYLVLKCARLCYEGLLSVKK